jgi:hypothetical protein
LDRNDGLYLTRQRPSIALVKRAGNSITYIVFSHRNSSLRVNFASLTVHMGNITISVLDLSFINKRYKGNKKLKLFFL